MFTTPRVFNSAEDDGPFFYTVVFTLVISFATILGRVRTMMPGTMGDHLAQISSLIDLLWLVGWYRGGKTHLSHGFSELVCT